jgi:hypothetical protein
LLLFLEKEELAFSMQQVSRRRRRVPDAGGRYHDPPGSWKNIASPHDNLDVMSQVRLQEYWKN